MAIVKDVALYALSIFFFLLLFRLVMEWVFVFARSWRPTGLWLIPLELTYSVTDPPLKAIRRVLPPLRIGAVAIDLAFFVLFIAVIVLQRVVASL